MSDYLITLLKANDLKYSVIAREKNSEYAREIFNINAKKIDGHFILISDFSDEDYKIFGLSHTIHGAYKKMYNEGLRVVEELRHRYNRGGELIINTKINKKRQKNASDNINRKKLKTPFP